MKTTITFILGCLFFAFSNYCNAQKILEYDFYSREIRFDGKYVKCKDEIKLKRSDGCFIVKVSNINLLLYDVKIDVDGKELNNSPQDVLSKYLAIQLSEEAKLNSDNEDGEANVVNSNCYYESAKNILKLLLVSPLIFPNDIEQFIKAVETDTCDKTKQEKFIRELLNFQTAPIQCENDVIKITITITPKGTADKGVGATLKSDKVNLEIIRYHYFDVSFSSGLTFSTLVDNKYGIKPNFNADTITNYSIKQDSIGVGTIGPSALMHISYKLQPGFALGAHLGVCVPVTDGAKPQYLAGVSILFGNKNRIGLNLSYAYGQVKQLSASTDQSRFYKEKPEINLIDRWQGKFAISLTYNIYNPK